jgi:hypothetical protein
MNIARQFPLKMAMAAVSTAWLFLGLAHSSPLTQGNLIASVNEFTGSSSAPTYVAEYTMTGTRVQILANVPQPGSTGPTTEEARDLILGPGNAIHLYNGTFSPYLARLDLNTLAWTQQTFAGWSTVNNLSYGGLARLGQYVFATDMNTGGGAPAGVVRFDTGGGPTVRFAGTIEPIDLNMGPSAVLYTLPGASSPNDTVAKYDANTLASLGTVTIQFDDNRALAVASDGSIFVATWGGVIRRYSAAGSLLDSLTVPGANFADIDINAAGQIALGTGFEGDIILTDLALDAFTRFRATDSTLGGEVFVAWVEPQAVPAPRSGSLLALAFMVLVAYRMLLGHRAVASAPGVTGV